MKRMSFVIPVKNESKTLMKLVSDILDVVDTHCKGWEPEIFVIDDGSDDDSWPVIRNLVQNHNHTVRGIRLRRNFGKSVALEAGFRAASGDVVFTLDGDLQDDPKEIPRFVEKLEQGFDLVSGWKIVRQDPLSKTFPSRLFNRVTSFATGIRLHDFNCGFKCYRREVIDRLRVYGELHRYLPVLADDLGYRVGEIEVSHHPRQYGQSKFGWERYGRGMVDLITVLATTRWLNKPGHLFGGIGIALGMAGTAVLTYLGILWFMGSGPIGTRPLFMIGVVLCIFSLQIISLGIIAEFFIRVKNPRSVEMLISESVGFQRETALSEGTQTGRGPFEKN